MHSGTFAVNLDPGPESEGEGEQVTLTAPVLPANVVAEMQLAFPGLRSEEGAIAAGSSSIYASGVEPLHEAEMGDLRAYRELPDCMRPLPMLPANLAPERAERVTVVTRAYAEAADGSLAVELTNHPHYHRGEQPAVPRGGRG